MRLDVATPDEVVARDRISHAMWGMGLPVETHVGRERRLRGGLWPRDRLVAWFLREDDAVLASCETYRVECTVSDRAGVVFEIASVYVEPALRGRGLASALLGALESHLHEQGDALVLFSDVGAGMYERLGFVARPAWDRVVPAEPGDPGEGVDLFGETELAAVHARMPRPAGRFVLWPSLAQVDWHLDRARTLAEARGRPHPARCGAMLGDGAVVWAEESGVLLVLLLVAPDRAQATALLRAAARTAAAMGLPEVRAWETPDVPWTAPREARRGCLPMIRPWGYVGAEDWTWIPRSVWV